MTHPYPTLRGAHAGATGRVARIAGHAFAARRATGQTAYVIAPDISHYQAELTTAYPRDFVVFKATQGVSYLDQHFLANAGVATSLHLQGKLAGAVCYHVYSTDTPAAQFEKIKAAIGPTPPVWLAGVMIDLESWSGTAYAIRGDRSSAVNELGALLAAWLGSWRRVWLYGNQYDLRSLAPRRDQRMPVVVAAYTSQLVYTSVPGAIGQQYSDGETKWSVPVVNGQPLPRSTSSLGNCDHNYFPGFADGFALRSWMGNENDNLLEWIMSLPGAPEGLTYQMLLRDIAKVSADAVWHDDVIPNPSADPKAVHDNPTWQAASVLVQLYKRETQDIELDRKA